MLQYVVNTQTGYILNLNRPRQRKQVYCGCVMGKGGFIASTSRLSLHAHAHVLPHVLPRCPGESASDRPEVVAVH